MELGRRRRREKQKTRWEEATAPCGDGWRERETENGVSYMVNITRWEASEPLCFSTACSGKGLKVRHGLEVPDLILPRVLPLPIQKSFPSRRETAGDRRDVMMARDDGMGCWHGMVAWDDSMMGKEVWMGVFRSTFRVSAKDPSSLLVVTEWNSN